GAGGGPHQWSLRLAELDASALPRKVAAVRGSCPAVRHRRRGLDHATSRWPQPGGQGIRGCADGVWWRRRTVVERVCRRCGGDARRDADQSVPPGWDGGGPSSRAGGDCRGATAAAVPDVAANRGVGPRGVESRIPGGTVRAAISLTTARWPADQPSRTKVTFRITRYPTILPSSMITFWLWTHASV